MKRYIKTALMPELLAYLGYTDAKAAGEGRYQVTGYGISYPGILRDADQERSQAAALKRLLASSGSKKEILARRLLADDAFMEELEGGTRELSDAELLAVSGVYQVKREALSGGVIKKQALDLEKELARCRALLSEMTGILKKQIERVESRTGNERFFVKPAQEADVYLIFDAAVMDFVRGAKGEYLAFDDPVEALDTAYSLEQMRPEILPKENRTQEIEKTGKKEVEENRFSCVRESGLLFIFDREKSAADGSEALAAVSDENGVITFFEEVTEKEENRIYQEVMRQMEKEKGQERILPLQK